jgi:hypothetical protein
LSLSLSTRLFTFNIGEGGEESRINGAYHYVERNEERNEPSMRAEPSRAEPSQSENLKHSKEIFENITPPFEIKSLSLDAYLVCDL